MKRISLPNIANRISLSAVRRHGVARYVVAVIVAAVALAGAAFGAYALSVEPEALISSDGYALPNDDAIDALAELSSAGAGAADIEPVAFQAGDALWSGFTGLSVGEHRTPISSTFPLFINDGAAVQIARPEGALITRTYDELESYAGLIVSEGRAYTQTGEAEDADTYRFLSVGRGVYVVLQSMHLKATDLDETLPMGSIVVFTESAVATYRLDEGVLTASRMTVFPQATRVSFGPNKEDEQTYDALLRGLGLLSDPAQQSSSAESEPESEPEDAAPNRERQNTTVTVEPPTQKAPATEELPNTGSPAPNSDADSGDGDSTGSDEPGEPGEWQWAKPEVGAAEFVPSVYQATSTLTVNDPAAVISRPVRFEFRRNGSLYMRASYTASGALTVQGLEPNTTYDITGYLTYRNRAGKEVEEEFFTQTITTGDPSSLEPMQISFAQGDLYPERLQFANVAFAGGSAELLANASGLSFEVDGRSFALSSELRAQMLKGEKVTYTTSASFDPGTTYQVSLAATDRADNPLPLRSASAEIRTCKAKPRARLHMVKNESSNLVIGVDLTDDYQAIAGKATLNLYDDTGTLIESAELKVGAHEYSFGDLGYDRLLHAKVTCSYDLDDGKGLHEGDVVGTMDFTTVSISVLGYAVYATTVSDVTDTSATLNVSLNIGQMDARLVALLTHGSVSAGLEREEPVFTHEFTTSEMEALRRGEKLQLRMAGFDSMTTYRISTIAGAQIGDTETGIYNEVKTTNRVDSFKTLRHPAVAEFKNTVVMGNQILFDARVLDVDDAVGENVMLEVRDRFGRLMGDQLRFDPVGSPQDAGWQECSFKDLEQDQPYTVNVVAYDYNQGFDNGTLQSRAVLYSGEIVTTNGVSGTITLRGVDEVAGNAGKLDVRARVEIADLWNELNPHQFTVEVLRNNEVIDSYAVPFAGTNDTVDLEPYRIDRSDATYKLRLLVHHHQGKRVELSEVDFSAEHGLIGIANENDLKTLPKSDLDGHFIVLDDIATTAIDVAVTDNAKRFEGSIDFQGYTITLNRKTSTPANPQRRGLIEYLGKNGVLKNAVLVVDGTPYGSLVEQCFGTISNVKVSLKAPGTTDPKVRQSMGGIVWRLEPTGVLENFAVNLGGDHLVGTNSGGVASGVNNGVVRNGYVYGGRLVSAEGLPSGTTLEQVGGIAGWVESGSSLSNLMSMVDIVAPRDNPSIEYGLIAGRRMGCEVSGLLATGSLVNYYNENGKNDTKFGPLIGSAVSSITARNKNMYYMGAMPTGAVSDGSASVSPLALYDREWYEEYLDPDGALDLSPVLRECFPQVKFPSIMGAQDYVPLPAKPEVHVPTITSVRVLDNGDSEATVQVSFSNPDQYLIESLEVAGALCDVVGQEPDIDDPSITRVTARVYVGEAQQCLSSYSVVSMTYKLYDGKSERETYQAGEYVIDIEFWRTISSVDKWIAMNGSSENFRLKADLDFDGRKAKEIQITNFYGKFDGLGHTVSNVNDPAMSYLFGNLKNATVMNLNVDGLNIAKRDSGALFWDVSTGSLIDHVRVTNAALSVREYGAGLVRAMTTSSVVSNCSVSDSSITVIDDKNFRTVYVGGLVASLNHSTVTNCYVQDVSIVATDADAHTGVGGLIGYVANIANVEQSYATGSILAAHGRIGGIAGVTTSNNDTFRSVWSDVDITTDSNMIGGLLGEVIASTYQPMPSLSLGDVYTTALGKGDIGHVYGLIRNSAAVLTGAYYFDGQMVTGQSNDLGSPLSYEQLCQPATYSEVIGMTSFDLSRVGEGILPKVLDTNGNVLPGQRDHHIVEPGSIEVTNVIAGRAGGDYSVQVEVDHEPGDVIVGAQFDWLESAGKVEVHQSGDSHSTLVYRKLNPERAYDVYRLETIKFERGGKKRSQRVGERLYFGEPVYKEIKSIEDWKKIDPTSFENYRLTGDLDFAGLGYSDGNFGVKVNRLDGRPSNGKNPTIKNIDVIYATRETGCSLIDTVRSSITNIDFQNITMGTDGAMVPTFGPSIVRTMLGAGDPEDLGITNGARNINLSGMKLTAKPVGNGYNTASYMGMIGRLDGDVSGVRVSDVSIYADTDYKNPGGYHYGSVVGSGTVFSTISDVDIRGVDITIGGSYAGGVAGTLGDTTMGYASDITIADTTVRANRHTANSFIGGAIGRCYRVDDVTVTGTRTGDSSTTTVAGVGKNVGGIVGEGKVQNAKVDGVVVRGLAYVGGMAGSGAVNTWLSGGYVEETASTVNNCLVEGIGEGNKYIGGSCGLVNGTTINLRISNTTVTGHSYVGGHAGIVSGTNYYIYVDGCEVIGEGERVGGIAGSGAVYNNGVSNTTVRGGTRVGGIVGYATTASHSYVSNTTVSGNDAVGGFAGELNVRGNTGSTVSVQATVHAETGAAGGLVGRLGPEYHPSMTLTQFSKGIFTGSVSGKIAGGVFGDAVSGVNVNDTGFLVAGSVSGDAAGILVGNQHVSGTAANNTMRVVMVHNSTSLNGQHFDKESVLSALGCAAEAVHFVSRDDILVTGEELADAGKVEGLNEYKLYVNSAASSVKPRGLTFDPAEWEIATSIQKDAFPQPKVNRVYGADGKLVRAVAPDQLLITVPDDFGSAPLPEDEVKPADLSADAAGLRVYPSGVNTFNIEFPADALDSRFEIIGEKSAEESEDAEKSEVLASGTVGQRTYTFAWDFVTPLAVRLHGADGTRSFGIDPADVMRAAAVWGDAAYWIAGDGVRGLDDSLVEGDFVNLYGGRALTRVGSIVDVADEVSGAAEPLGRGEVLRALDEPVPVAAGEGWATFAGYTEVDGGAVRDVRLYPCGPDVYGVSNELDIVADGYVFADGAVLSALDAEAGKEDSEVEPSANEVPMEDAAAVPEGDAHYRTVLMADGTLRDLADPLVYPDGFKNEGIASMTNTAAARVPLVVVRYDSGLMVCFDYTTGEVKFQKQGSGEDLSLLDYAGGFFDGLVDGLFGGGDAAAGDNGYGDALALEDRASHGGLVGLDSGGSGAAGTGSSGDADGAGDASAGAPGGSAGSGAGTGSSVGGFASGTDYVSVYEPSSGGYVTYAVDDLLNGNFEGVASVNKTYDIPAAGGDPVAVTTQAPAALGAGGLGAAGPVALFSSAILGILAILLFI